MIYTLEQIQATFDMTVDVYLDIWDDIIFPTDLTADQQEEIREICHAKIKELHVPNWNDEKLRNACAGQQMCLALFVDGIYQITEDPRYQILREKIRVDYLDFKPKMDINCHVKSCLNLFKCIDHD